MSKSQSYAYLALEGVDFDPDEITARLGIEPTKRWRKGDKTPYGALRKQASWLWETKRGTEPIWVDNLVTEVVVAFESKADLLLQIKRQYELESVLAIVLYIDTNDTQSTPALGHDLRTINFLYQTQTSTDVDIYRYNSGARKSVL